MRDYSKGKIYKIWSPSHIDLGCYIGSTTQPLHKRFWCHKANQNRCSSKIFFEYDDVRIDLLEEYPCENIEQLSAKEGEWILKGGCVNKRVAGRARGEYREANREKLNEEAKKYREANRERIIEYREANREKLNEKRREYYRRKGK